VRTNTSTCTKRPPTPRRLLDNAAILHRESPKARAEAKARARTSVPRAHSEVTSQSHHDAMEHVDDSEQRAQPDPLVRGDALPEHDIAQHTPC